MILGMIGGFIGLIWSLIANCLGDFESFRFNESLISEIYRTTYKERMKHGQVPSDLDTAKVDVSHGIETCTRYKYNYEEYWLTWVIISLCCCCNRRTCYKHRQKRYQRHELAVSQLSKESDFFKFLKLLRVTDFLSKVLLKKHQRRLIPYFKKYLLTQVEGDKDSSVFDVSRLGSTAQSLLNGVDESEQLLQVKQEILLHSVQEQFGQESDPLDLAILYEITGFQGDSPEDDQDFWENYANYKDALTD